MKVVINRCYGGFGLSLEGLRAYAEAKGVEVEEREDEWGHRHLYQKEDGRLYWDHDIPRDDPDLIRLVEAGERGGSCADLKVVEIPDGVAWQIEGYDGMEWVAEKHRAWG